MNLTQRTRVVSGNESVLEGEAAAALSQRYSSGLNSMNESFEDQKDEIPMPVIKQPPSKGQAQAQ